MTIQDLNLNKLDHNEIQELLDSGKLRLSKSEFKWLLDEFAGSVLDGKYVSSSNALHIALLKDKDGTFEFIRKKGIFRYSHYNGKKCIVRSLAEYARRILSFLEPIQEIETYLESIINFAFVHEEYARRNLIIQKAFRDFERNYKGFSLLKTLLSHIELLFLIDEPPAKRTLERNMASMIREDICSATSYLIYLLTFAKAKVDAGGKVSAEFIMDGELEKMILAAYRIEAYKDMELQIDHYGYQLTESRNVLNFRAPSVEFEKLVRLGYIRTDTQAMNNGIAFIKNTEGINMMSIGDFVMLY